MINDKFLYAISRSFEAFLIKGTSRSTDKLKPLHGIIAKDIANKIGDDYEVWAQGYGPDREIDIAGRYMNKKVDITIKSKRTNKPVAGIAVKFVMQNYSQNSNNYFENMLGETANIRCAACPYFQVFIILDKLPYYNKAKRITHWENFTEHNISKYIVLSQDDVNVYFHTPNKTLIYVVHIPDAPELVTTQESYLAFYRDCFKRPGNVMTLSSNHFENFESAVILNNYAYFIDKIYYTIMLNQNPNQNP